MNRSRLLLLALTLVLALPPGLFAGHETAIPRATVAPGLAAPQETEHRSVTAGLDARKKGNRKGKRRERKERRQERQNRQRPGLTPEQARIEALVDVAPPRIPALALEDDPCGPGLMQLPKSGRCTHGPDDLPPAEVVAPDRTPLTAAQARRAAAEVACDDDGVSGFRVQVLYLRAASGTDNYTTYLDNIRAWAAGADTILRESSTAAGQEMGFTFVMTDGCQIAVDNVAIGSSAIRSFDATITALEQQGYDRVDRIYLMFADTTSAGICGIGTMWDDDRPTTSNYNNRGPSYARADRVCWDSHTAAHELMHNLGAVQNSAPHTTGFGHCIDEYDVMCYRDAQQAPPMQFICNPQSTFEVRYDCGNDDYFDPLPDSGSYLATHWNSARNWFLTRDIPAGTDLTPPSVTWEAPVGNGQTYTATSTGVPLRARATDESGVDRVEFWLYDATRDDWDFLGEDLSAPYEGSVNTSTLRSGLNYLTADAYDTQGNWTDEGIWIEQAGGVAATTIALVTSTARVKARKQVSITAAVANPPASGTSVEFRVCRGGSCTWEAGQSLGVFPGPSPSTTWRASGKGQVTFLAQVTSEAGSMTSNPATISVKKVKKKR